MRGLFFEGHGERTKAAPQEGILFFSPFYELRFRL